MSNEKIIEIVNVIINVIDERINVYDRWKNDICVHESPQDSTQLLIDKLTEILRKE